MVLAEKYQYKQETEIKNKPTQSVRKAKKRLPIRWMVGIALLIIANLVFQALLVQRDFESRNLSDLIQKKERQIAKLNIEMSELSSFERIHELAQHDLGMKLAGTGDYQCIAAIAGEEARNTQRVNEDASKNLWAQVSSWFSGFGETMAKNQ